MAPEPRRPVPVGWVGYRGTTLSFALAHPAGWVVDDSAASVGETSFTEPGKQPISITVTGRPAPSPQIDGNVRRARFISYTTRSCETGRSVLDRGSLTAAGLAFTTATVRCGGEEEEAGKGDAGATYFLGVAVKDGMQWSFAFRTSNDDFARDRAEVIPSVLKTFNF